jgi:hypothetical protein
MVIRISIGILLLCGFFCELTMLDITGQLPDAAQTSTIVSNVRFGLEGTVGLYATEVLRNIGLVTITGVAFLWPPPKIRSSRALSKLSLFIMTLAIAGATAILVQTSSYTRLFPSPVTSYVNIVDSILMDRGGKLQEAEYAGSLGSNFEKIVFIMDESVRGDYLSINRPTINTNAQILRGLDRQEKMFIFVDKYGTHIPYDWMYPQEQNAFGADLSVVSRLFRTFDLG